MKKVTPLRKALVARGLTMRDVARVGIPYNTVVSHCLGTSIMSLRSAKRYAEKLGIPIAEIIGLEENQERKKKERKKAEHD